MPVMNERTLNILVVEDDEVDVMNIERAFKKNQLSYPVTIARDGIEALQKLRDGTVPRGRRLVLLDLNMPRMNGIEFLRELRADPALRSTCVVVLTTSNEDNDKIDAFNLNVAGYMLKPVTFHRFVDLMGALDRYWSLVELV
jgi:CheY-like chemotaxis protein